MAYKCRVCGSNDVNNQGDVCELCAIGIDPYANSMSSGQKPGPYINTPDDSAPTAYRPKSGQNRKILVGSTANDVDITPASSNPPVQVYGAGQVPQTVNTNSGNNYAPAPAVKAPAASSLPASAGIAKNIMSDNQKKSFFSKWFRALFSGVPYTFGDDITMLQVYPDYTGSALNASGNACDQVIIYGKLNSGIISENNNIEVYGRRDSHNNIIAKRIVNKASGTTVTPTGAISSGIVWLITLLILVPLVSFLVAGFQSILSVVGIILVIAIIIFVIRLFSRAKRFFGGGRRW